MENFLCPHRCSWGFSPRLRQGAAHGGGVVAGRAGHTSRDSPSRRQFTSPPSPAPRVAILLIHSPIPQGPVTEIPRSEPGSVLFFSHVDRSYSQTWLYVRTPWRLLDVQLPVPQACRGVGSEPCFFPRQAPRCFCHRAGFESHRLTARLLTGGVGAAVCCSWGPLPIPR